MIALRCDNCGKTVEVTTIVPFLSLHPDSRMRNTLPYCVEVRCPECDHVLGRDWAMVQTYYQWEFVPTEEVQQ